MERLWQELIGGAFLHSSVQYGRVTGRSDASSQTNVLIRKLSLISPVSSPVISQCKFCNVHLHQLLRDIFRSLFFNLPVQEYISGMPTLIVIYLKNNIWNLKHFIWWAKNRDNFISTRLLLYLMGRDPQSLLHTCHSHQQKVLICKQLRVEWDF